MRLSHKIKKLGAGETYRRSWRRAQRMIHPIRLQPLLDGLDQSQVLSIRERYSDSSEHYAKYADIRRWLALNIRRVQDLKLHRSPPSSVLDLGCGGGFFLYILQQFGHQGLGADIDEFPLFRELVELFQVQRMIFRIEPFQPLPNFGRRFDLITAFSTSFNRRTHQVWWGPKEWRYFLDNLKDQLRPRGKIFLGLNPDNTGSYYTPDLEACFRSYGAIIDRENVILAT
jgi:SAM-dependent methyltransferase